MAKLTVIDVLEKPQGGTIHVLKESRMKQKFNIIKSTCIPIAIDNCNTDLIIPARYLASTTRDPKFFGTP